ncbi:hypothetical protein SIO70_22710 [Chitinophaga sancti]|uniref:hypothetical protein n=1 Tax=Chitinophaga sancti TaxID=1004 RepID=UPI002A748B00|nr:hypothetical protein [Chitinophaga sancti]WPQ61175.1 hypothetical protein SIO70_22710 [Chitinophaga sancti]
MTYFEQIRHLYGIATQEGFGFEATELVQPLPLILKGYYLTLGKHAAVNYSHNRLLKPDQIVFSQDEYLIFYEENQGVVFWGIKKSDLALPNPPVYGNYSGDEMNPDWHQECATTDGFLLLMAVYNGVLGGLEFNANSFEAVPLETVVYVQENYVELKEISHATQRVFTIDYEEMVSLSFDKEGNCTGTFIGTNDGERFDKMLDQLDIEWSYISLEDEEI